VYKKIAILLILVFMCNMTLWGLNKEETDEKLEEILIAGGVIIVGVALLAWFTWWVIDELRTSKVDSSDNGIRMVSMDCEGSTNNSGFNNFMNVLQHIEVGTTLNNNIYLGLRLRY